MTVDEQVIWALARQSPMEPKLMKGKHVSDWYICGKCGGPTLQTNWHYCPNCGQRITDCSLGRRMTKKEQNTWHQTNIFDVMADELGKEVKP